MREVLGRGLVRAARVAAVLWLCGVAPLELATTLTGLMSGPGGPPLAGVLLLAARVATVAAGLMVGLRLARREDGLRRPAAWWALADLGTLAVALATDVLPSNRLPGTELIAWATYAVLDAIVVAVAPRDTPH